MDRSIRRADSERTIRKSIFPSVRPVFAIALTALAVVSLGPASEGDAPPNVHALEDFHLSEVAQIGGRTHAVVADRERLFVGSGQHVISLDPTVPGLPVRIGESPPLGHTVESLALHQSLLIVALGEGGLAGLNVGDVSTPRVVPFVGSIDGTANRVQVEDNRLYVRDDTSRVIVIFDLQHWPEVARLGEFPSRPYASWDVLGDVLIHVYPDFYGYFEVVDLEDPTEPRQVALERLDGNPCGTTFVGDHALVAFGAVEVAEEGFIDEHWKLDDYDLSDPAMPRLRGSTRSVPDSHLRCHGLVSAGERAILLSNIRYSSDATLHVVETTPTDPFVLADLHLHQIGDMVVERDRVYLTDDTWGSLAVASIASPAEIGMVGVFDMPGHLRSAAMVGSQVAMVDPFPEHTLHVADLSAPSSPRLLPPMDVRGQSVEMDGDWAYIGGDGNLEAVEVHDDRLERGPSAPIIGQATDLVSNKGRIYIAALDGPLQIFDHMDRAELRPAAVVPEISDTRRVGLVGESLYAISTTYNSRTPRSALWLVGTDDDGTAGPRPTARIDFDHETWGATSNGETLYLGTGHPVHILSYRVSGPGRPVLLDDVALPCCPASELVYHEGRIYATGARSVVGIDVTDPAEMHVLGEHVVYEPGVGGINAIAAGPAPGGGTLLSLATSNRGMVLLLDERATSGPPPVLGAPLILPALLRDSFLPSR